MLENQSDQIILYYEKLTFSPFIPPLVIFINPKQFLLDVSLREEGRKEEAFAEIPR